VRRESSGNSRLTFHVWRAEQNSRVYKSATQQKLNSSNSA